MWHIVGLEAVDSWKMGRKELYRIVMWSEFFIEVKLNLFSKCVIVMSKFFLLFTCFRMEIWLERGKNAVSLIYL